MMLKNASLPAARKMNGRQIPMQNEPSEWRALNALDEARKMLISVDNHARTFIVLLKAQSKTLKS